MADLHEVGALLHVHKALHEHGDAFPNLKKHVLKQLQDIETEHGPVVEPKPEPAEEPEIEEPVEEPIEGSETDEADPARRF